MRVLVTGVAGFVGPWVVAALREAGHEVHGLVRGAGPWPRLAAFSPSLHTGDSQRILFISDYHISFF